MYNGTKYQNFTKTHTVHRPISDTLIFLVFCNHNHYMSTNLCSADVTGCLVTANMLLSGL